MLTYLDLFAGAGGLSEGFIQAGYSPVAHVEMDTAACYTLKTRAAYHYLKSINKLSLYNQYLRGEITRQEFYQLIPGKVLNSVLNYEISEMSMPEIFEKIDSILGKHKLDYIIGGPPCQAYSLAGRARSEHRMIGDHRNYLYKLYAKFLQRYSPKFFVFENVVGLLSAKDEDGSLHFDNMRNLFRACGYSTEFKVLNAANYGVLQNRKRVILIGTLGKKENFYPEIKQLDFSEVTVSEIFSDLPKVSAGGGQYGPVNTLDYNGSYLYETKIKAYNREPVTFHIARPHTEQDLSIYKLAVNTWNKEHKRISYLDIPESLQTHRNITSFLDRFKVVAGDLPYSQTVVAHISRDGHYYIHPDINQNRSLTPREAARLQTFPDNFYFESTKGIPGRTSAFKQIGNAVPVRLAFSVANALLNINLGNNYD